MTNLFLQDYLFRGEHESKVRDLVNIIDERINAKIFNSAIELIQTAALIGVIYNKKSIPQKGEATFRIMAGQFNNHSTILNHIYKIVMLASESEILQNKDRINRAFRENNESKNNELFIEHMLGGIDFLHDHFFSDKKFSYTDLYTKMLKLIATKKMKTEDELGFEQFSF